MTIQTKQYIDLSDVVAFRFDCKQCGATLSLPLSDPRQKLALQHCPNCKTAWTMTTGLDYNQLISDFRESLKRMGEITQEDSPHKLEFTMVLEVKQESALRTMPKTA